MGWFFSRTLRKRPPGSAIPTGIESTSTSVTESMLSSESPRSAAPSATHSSGCTPLRGAFPKCSRMRSWTSGMRLWPPTRITSSTSRGRIPSPEHAVADLEGPVHEVPGEIVQLRAGERQAQVEGPPFRSSRNGRSIIALG